MTWLPAMVDRPAPCVAPHRSVTGFYGLRAAGQPRRLSRMNGFSPTVQEAEVIPKGGWEFEQWLTFRKGYPEGDHRYDQYLWDFREEIEYGFTDKLSGALYLNFKQDQVIAQEPGLEDSSKFSFEGVSAELKYQLLNPNTKPVGIALYFEPTYNGNEVELEYKLISRRTWATSGSWQPTPSSNRSGRRKMV